MDSKFQPTRWTLVLNAKGRGTEAEGALAELCDAYYGPVMAFLRREGRTEDQAREAAHTFFESVLTRGLGNPNPERGRFRSFLLGALKNFLTKSRAASLAMKRGAGAEHVALEEQFDEPPSSAPESALWFDREWAFAVISRALATVEREHLGKERKFALLKPWLSGGLEQSQLEVAEELEMTVTAVKVAIYRLRERFRAAIQAEVAATVFDPADLADEFQHLIEIVSRGEDGS